MSRDDTTPAAAGLRECHPTVERHSDLFGLLVASVRDYAIFILDASGRVATWNIGAERIKGYGADEIIGRHFSTFYPEAEVRAGKCELELEIAAHDGRFEEEGWRLRKDGTRFWASVVITAMRDPDGALVGFAKVTRDLTERRRAEQEQAALLAAEQANRVKDEFLAMLGHELRNPLAPIVTALQLMKLRGDRRVAKEQQIIERQVKHMMHLVDDLLDVSRITQGKIELRRHPTDVRDAVAQAIETATPLMEQRGHQLEVVAPDHAVVVDGDDDRLAQVFTNLLMNAAKYTNAGGRIAVAVRPTGREVLVEVRDDGIGIAPELLPRIFELFVQGGQGKERPSGGLGIGLTLVRTLVTLHGGTVEARSAGVGMGSTFIVRLPVVASPPRADDEHAAALVANPSERRRILIVDDNHDALVLLARVLSAAGHDVRTARDAAGALRAVEVFAPDVAIVDIGLPVMDGYELAAHLRAKLTPRVPRLIALTGYGQPQDRERSRQAGFDVHLVKPVDVPRLLASVGAPK